MSTRYYNPEVGRFLNADVFTATGQNILGNNMFAYCNNAPVSNLDASGTFVLTTAAVIGIGIGISAIIGGTVSAVNTAASGGSGWEVLCSGLIGAAVSGGIAAVAAFVPASAIGATTIISATIGGVGELLSQGVEYAFHKNDPSYEYDPLVSAGKVLYSAAMGGLSGYVSAGINASFNSNDIAGTFTSSVAAASLGGVDFGTRQVISATTSKAKTSTTSTPAQARTVVPKQRRSVPRNYLMAPY